MNDPDDALSLYPAPRALGETGAPMWAHLTEHYAWRYDELLLVERACRLAEVVARREREVADLTTFSSLDGRGNPVDNPVAAGLARDVNALRLLISGLGIASSSAPAKGATSPARSVAARNAAYARWNKGGA